MFIMPFARVNFIVYSFYRFVTRSIVAKNQQISFKPGPSRNPVLSLRHEGAEHLPMRTDKQGRCKQCGVNTTYKCAKCSVLLHTKCFDLYHRK
jgi:hypothetical protein